VYWLRPTRPRLVDGRPVFLWEVGLEDGGSTKVGGVLGEGGRMWLESGRRVELLLLELRGGGSSEGSESV
jgi:hypothetical protein